MRYLSFCVHPTESNLVKEPRPNGRALNRGRMGLQRITQIGLIELVGLMKIRTFKRRADLRLARHDEKIQRNHITGKEERKV
jgi:hypothetical protein